MLHALDSVAEVHSCRASSLGLSSCLPRFDVLIVSAEDFADAAGYAGVSLAADEAVRWGSKILLLLGRHAGGNLDAVTCLPCNGFLVQEEVTEEALDRSLSRILVGEIPMPAALASRLLAHARDANANTHGEGTKLTPRELEALNHLVGGLSNKQIAQRMLISPHGVKRLVANVLAKLNCSNRTLAAAVAVKQGLLERV